MQFRVIRCDGCIVFTEVEPDGLTHDEVRQLGEQLDCRVAFTVDVNEKPRLALAPTLLDVPNGGTDPYVIL